MIDTDVLPAFDEEVIRAMARWPDVPRCYDWLKLDRRGGWRIKDAPITHARAIAFLSRHYRADARGAWYVQNGPQQVYVELEYTPWVYRYDARDGFSTHTGLACARVETAVQDDDGNLLLETEYGIGVVDDRDLAACTALLSPRDSEAPTTFEWAGLSLALVSMARAEVASRFGFTPRPQPT